MKTIGILGGSSDVATAEYYKLINAGVKERLGGYSTGEIVIVSMNFGEVERIVNNDLWDEGVIYVTDKVRRLEGARADFIMCVSHTWHRIAEQWMKDAKIPLLHIVDPTAVAISSAGLKKVLLLGTRPTMSAMFLRDRYAERFNVDTIVPNEKDQEYINIVIFDELTQSAFKDSSRQGFLRIINDAREQGAQGAILGCTEIGLLVRQTDCPDLPLFDPLKLHANAAVQVALDGDPAIKSIQNLLS